MVLNEVGKDKIRFNNSEWEKREQVVYDKEG
jgi:hypothetical protein